MVAWLATVWSAVGCGTSAPTANRAELPREPCEAVDGWERITIPYQYFDEPDQRGAGVGLCIVADMKLSASLSFEHAVTLRGPDLTTDLVLEVMPDFESARDRLSFYDRSFCDADQYDWDYFSVSAWPALEQRFEEDVDFDPRRATTEYVYVAAGRHFMTLGVSAVPAGPSPVIDTVSLMGHTLTSRNGAEPVDVDMVLADLVNARPDGCP